MVPKISRVKAFNLIVFIHFQPQVIHAWTGAIALLQLFLAVWMVFQVIKILSTNITKIVFT